MEPTTPAPQTPGFELPPQLKAMLPMLLQQIPEETVKGLAISKAVQILQKQIDEVFAKNTEATGIAFLIIPELEDKKVVEVQIIVGITNAENTRIETPIKAFNLFDKINNTSKEDLMKSLS